MNRSLLDNLTLSERFIVKKISVVKAKADNKSAFAFLDENSYCFALHKIFQ